MTKIFRNFLFSIIILPLFGYTSQAQIRIVLGPFAGLTVPTMDYGGTTSDFYKGTGYGLSSGVHYGIMSKVALGPLNARLSVSYCSLEGTGQADPNQSSSTVDVKNSLFTFSIGTELGFGVPLVPVRPYIGIDLLFSTISGSAVFQNTDGISNNQISIQSSTRTGLGLAVGSEFKLGTSFSLDASLRYNLINLFGKSYNVVGNSSRADGYSFVNDAADPNYNSSSNAHFIGNSRTIGTLQLQLGILFGF
jgi:opacity protein-like surface antigen